MKYLDSLLLCRHDSGEVFVYYKGIEVAMVKGKVLDFKKGASPADIDRVKELLEFNLRSEFVVDYQI